MNLDLYKGLRLFKKPLKNRKITFLKKNEKIFIKSLIMFLIYIGQLHEESFGKNDLIRVCRD